MEQFLTFLYGHWFTILLGLWVIWIGIRLGKDWFKEQWEWLKDFFEDPDAQKPSSRRAIEVAIVWVFLISYLKVSLQTEALQDIPWGWGILIAGMLGLKTLDAYVKGKATNGTSGTNGSTTATTK